MLKTIATLVTIALLNGCAAQQPGQTAPQTSAAGQTRACPSPGRWVLTGHEGNLTSAAMLDQISQARVVLLGERHDRADEHRWQLQVLAAIQGRHSGTVAGFEMFSRTQQDDLDRWVSGELSEAEFLERVDWDRTWGYPAELYLPLLHFVRLNQMPAVALNIERELLQRISREGWDAVPLDERYQIRQAAPGPAAYDAMLDEIMSAHQQGSEPASEQQKEAFRRAQSAWDRAMAAALAVALENQPGPVVAMVGRGHMQWGYGIPYQLADLGIDGVVSLLPFEPGDRCLGDQPAPADGLFGLPPRPSSEPGT